jgi:uncharacterized protein YcbX
MFSKNIITWRFVALLIHLDYQFYKLDPETHVKRRRDAAAQMETATNDAEMVDMTNSKEEEVEILTPSKPQPKTPDKPWSPWRTSKLATREANWWRSSWAGARETLKQMEYKFCYISYNTVKVVSVNNGSLAWARMKNHLALARVNTVTLNKYTDMAATEINTSLRGHWWYLLTCLNIIGHPSLG